MAALFKKFQARYGLKWVASIEGIEDIAIEEWGKGLAGLSGKQIGFGLRNWQKDWPPSMSEFVKICKSSKIQAHRIFPALELKKSDQEVGMSAIKSLRDTLNGLSD